MPKYTSRWQGKNVHKFTCKDIARAAGLSHGRVLIAKRDGLLDPNDLRDVARFVFLRRIRKGTEIPRSVGDILRLLVPPAYVDPVRRGLRKIGKKLKLPMTDAKHYGLCLIAICLEGSDGLRIDEPIGRSSEEGGQVVSVAPEDSGLRPVSG